MAISVTHTFVSAVVDDPASAAAGEVLPSHWNAGHTITGLDAADITTALGFTPIDAAAFVPPGADTQVLFNDGGAWGADANLTYNKTLYQLSVGPTTYWTGYTVKPTLNVENTYTDFNSVDFVFGVALSATLDRSSIDDWVASYYAIHSETYIQGLKDYPEINGASFGIGHSGSGTIDNVYVVSNSGHTTGSGNIGNFFANYAVTENAGTGTISQIYNYYARIGCRTGATITTANAFHCNAPIGAGESGGTVGTLYGIHFDDLSVLNPATGYFIYSAWDAPSVLAGTVQAKGFIDTSLTASQVVLTDANKNLVSGGAIGVLATGVGHTVDDVIAYLQSIGLCTQA